MPAQTRDRQHALAEPEQVPCDARLRVGEERQYPRLGVPEVVPVVGVAGQALGRDAGTLGTPCCLSEVEDVPADRLLNSDRMPDGVLYGHVGTIPEPVQTAPLGGYQRFEAGRGDAPERVSAPPGEFLDRDAARALVGGILHEPDG